MKSYDYYSVIFENNVYCVDCLPEGIDPDNEGVMPIYSASEWDYVPVCVVCGQEQDYVTLTSLFE
jgi:hypothetical protein